MRDQILRDEKREAVNSIRGYLWQFVHTTACILKSEGDERTYVEAFEDIQTIDSQGHLILKQIKDEASDLSLTSKPVCEMLERWSKIYVQRSDTRFVFVSTKSASNLFDHSTSFKDWVNGLRTPENFQRVRKSLSNFVAKFDTGELPTLARLLSVSTDAEQFWNAISWNLGEPSLSAKFEELIKLIEFHCKESRSEFLHARAYAFVGAVAYHAASVVLGDRCWTRDKLLSVLPDDVRYNSVIAELRTHVEHIVTRVNAIWDDTRELKSMAGGLVEPQRISISEVQLQAAELAFSNYKNSIRQQWWEHWNRFESNADSSTPPFIDTQGLRILNKEHTLCNPRKSIYAPTFRRERDETTDKRGSFKIRHRASDINLDFAANKKGKWLKIARKRLVASLQSQNIRRLLVTTDAGLGKTTNMRWLNSALNAATTQCTSFLLNVADLPRSSSESLDELLAERILQAGGNEDIQISRATLTKYVQNQRATGRIVLLLDALDQVELFDSTTSANRLRDVIRDQRWARCTLVLGSRPFALHRDWELLFESDFAPGWDLLQIEEFSSKEQARYLGSQRLAQLPYDVQEILGVPRVLYYLRKTPDTEFQQINSASDVYSLATTNLLEEGLRASESRVLSPEAAKLLLCAIAFEMSLVERNFDRLREENMTMFLNNVAKRCKGFNEEFGYDWVQRTLRQIVSMNEFLAHAILTAGFPREIQWRNRSLQEYFAALWATKYGTTDDSQILNELQYTPHSIDTPDFYWIWRYAVEMPLVGRTASRWLDLVGPLFNRNHCDSVQRRRPSEMIYRSWETLATYLTHQETASESFRLARLYFAKFHNEIREILHGHQGLNRKKIAQQLFDDFVTIPPHVTPNGQSEFNMGSPETEGGRGPHEQLSAQRLKTPFLLSARCVTVEQFELFDPSFNQNLRSGRLWPRSPATHVSWYDGWVFCRWLGERTRLPNEVEWEFACRAGTTTPYSFGADAHFLRRYANCGMFGGGDVRQRPIPVGCLEPNSWGLHDMHGNCWEWCANSYFEMSSNHTEIERRPDYKTIRGGSFNTSRYRVRSAERAFRAPEESSLGVGFRICRSSM